MGPGEPFYPHGPRAANDDAANDNFLKDNEHETANDNVDIDNKALRDVMKEIDEAEPGAIIFTGGVMNPQAWSESGVTTSTRASAQGADVAREALAQREDIYFVEHELLHPTGDNYEHALAGLKRAIREHPEQKIVCDSNFLLTQNLFKPWKAEDAAGFDPLSRGKQNTDTLTQWLEDMADENTDPEEMLKSEVLEERFGAACQPLRDLSLTFANRPLVFSLALDNPLALAFLVFAAKDSLDPADIKAALRGFRASSRAVGFVQVQNGKFSAALGDKKFRARRLAP